MSSQLYNGEITLSQSTFDIVEAHSDRTPEHRFLVIVSHDHAVLNVVLGGEEVRARNFRLQYIEEGKTNRPMKCVYSK